MYVECDRLCKHIRKHYNLLVYAKYCCGFKLHCGCPTFLAGWQEDSCKLSPDVGSAKEEEEQALVLKMQSRQQ